MFIALHFCEHFNNFISDEAYKRCSEILEIFETFKSNSVVAAQHVVALSKAFGLPVILLAYNVLNFVLLTLYSQLEVTGLCHTSGRKSFDSGCRIPIFTGVKTMSTQSLSLRAALLVSVLRLRDIGVFREAGSEKSEPLSTAICKLQWSFGAFGGYYEQGQSCLSILGMCGLGC